MIKRKPQITITGEANAYAGSWAAGSTALYTSLYRPLLIGESLTWQSSLDKLTSFSNLQNSWDYGGAPAPSAELIHSVVYLLRALREDNGFPAPSRILPMQTGGIFIEWQLEDEYIDVEIDQPYVSEWFTINKLGREGHYEKHWDRPSTVKSSSSIQVDDEVYAFNEIDVNSVATY